MAIAFVEEKKKQKKLLIVFVLLIAAILGLLAYYLIKRIEPSGMPDEQISSSFKKPDIDFGVFENKSLQSLVQFESIKPFEGVRGRENPFLPYGK